MSYLNVPRIHFSGRFFTDPSTVNNDPTHYDPECTNPSPWQEPNGQHRFQLKNCLIKSILGENGYVSSDPLIGSELVSTDQPSPAKIVDLDVYQQGVSTIYGLELKINLPDGGSIKGLMTPTALNDCWFNCVLPKRSWNPSDYTMDSFGGDMNAAGFFQSIITIKKEDWKDTSSDVLQKLKQITYSDDNGYQLSLKFTLDGYRNVPEDLDFRTGRITGAIGPYFENEPLFNPGKQWLFPRAFSETQAWNWPSFNNCPYAVDEARSTLILDLSNGICRQNAGGPPVDLGTLSAVVDLPDGQKVNLGKVDYSAFSYDNNAQICELPLTSDQVSAIYQGSLSLIMSREDLGEQTVLKGKASVLDYAAEVRSVRMEGNPGTKASTTVYCSINGKPVADKQLAIHIESVHGNTPGATVPPNSPGNTPQADGAIKADITPSDANGFAEVTIEVLKDPGRRTEELDGQLYFIIVYDPNAEKPDWSKVAPAQNHLISCVAWSLYETNKNPEWAEIEKMMAPYMKLYPFMKQRIDLSDEHSFGVYANNPPWEAVYFTKRVGPLGITRGAIPFYMSVDFDDPRFMPLSRDLSPSRIMTIMYYIKNLQSQ